ncbi:MAG: hypothetical protein K8S55_12080, partial [Phycisphaerae bacterium]|nr:hypothetical protein [Phycisphaerae bacterium]
VSGRFSRFRGRVRPRNWAVMSVSQRQAWERQVIAEQEQSATITAAAAASRKANLKIWKQVATTIKEKGEVQGIIENFFLEKGIKLMDQAAVKKTNKRDLMLASADDDLAAVAALGAKFNADVIILGTAAAKPGNEITVAGVTMYKYPTKLVVRVIRTDSGQLMASKVYSETKTSTLKSGGEAKALDKLARQAAPKLLAAVVEAWRKQVNVTRDINLQIAGMTFAEWKTFRKTVEALRGVKALRLREITAGVANIDAEYEFTTQSLADEMTELKTPKLEVTEFNPNRLKMKVVK